MAVIEWFLQFDYPWLVNFFRAITLLGNEEYYMITIPLIYWLFSKEFGFRFAVFFLLSAYTNSALKYNFATERPMIQLRRITEVGFSFPSGHAQGSTAFWGYLALQLKKRWGYILAAILIILIGISRVFLGVHFPIDIVSGIGVGIILLALYEYAARNIKLKLSTKGWMLLSSGVLILLLLNHSQGDGPMTVGFALGLIWGYAWEKDYVGYNEKGFWWQQIVKGALGLTIFFVLRIALKAFFSDILNLSEIAGYGFLIIFLRYFLMGLWASVGAPWVFKKLSLSKKTLSPSDLQS